MRPGIRVNAAGLQVGGNPLDAPPFPVQSSDSIQREGWAAWFVFCVVLLDADNLRAGFRVCLRGCVCLQ